MLNAENLVKELEAKTGEKWLINTVLKENGIKLTSVHKNSTISRNYYLEQLGDKVDEAVEFILAEETNPLPVDFPTNFKEMKLDNIELRILNKRFNEELLETLPHVEVCEDGDVVAICVNIVEESELGSASFKVSYDHIKAKGISELELFEIARENTLRKYQPCCRSLSDILKEMGAPVPDDDNDDILIRVITLGSGNYGSRILAFPEVISELLGDDNYYIIPSSLHELLAVRKDEEDSGQKFELMEMVREVNDTCVSQRDILSYSLYQYNAADKTISCATTDMIVASA